MSLLDATDPKRDPKTPDLSSAKNGDWTPWDDEDCAAAAEIDSILPSKPGLAAEQVAALEVLKSGKNVFLTGCAGTGKTYLLNAFIDWATEQGLVVAVTAYTGVASLQLNGSTLHRWLGSRPGDTPQRTVSRESFANYRLEPIVATDILIIDEVSMVSRKFLDFAGRVCEIVRTDDGMNKDGVYAGPFGGLQVILVGDFGQLPPVADKCHRCKKAVPVDVATCPSCEADVTALDLGEFCFKSETWKELELETVKLKHVHRQESKEFVAILDEIRCGKLSKESYNALAARFKVSDWEAWGGILLSTHNDFVRDTNNDKLVAISREMFEYRAHEEGIAWAIEKLDEYCTSPRILKLKVGARVMFTRNHADGLYVNGTVGTVTDLAKNSITVKTDKGRVIKPDQTEWSIQDSQNDARPLAMRRQFPLVLAWAITIHKSQGATFDRVSISIKREFAAGQAYVAFSRVKSIEGLNIVAWKRTQTFKTNAEVTAFLESLE